MHRVEPIIYRREQNGTVEFMSGVDGHTLTHLLYEAGKEKGTPKMSIGVLGYKHIEDTKRCVESVLRFVGDIDYELILMDNGSNDENETLEYYQSVPTDRKKIIQVEDPLGPAFGCIFGTRLMYEYARGDIFVFLGNDNIITENALQNMIICLESSPDIGLVTPMSSNAYMLQNPGLQYSNFEEMHAVAKAFNQSDPRKWQERIQTSTVATAIKREALVRSGFYGFWTAEIDMCHRIRLAGYKLILLGDTWVCHNHNYGEKEETHKLTSDNSIEAMQEARLGGLKLFSDIMIFENQLLSLLEKPSEKVPKLLAVNVAAGQPLLDVKNRLREYEIFDSEASAFTTDAKYYTLLLSVANQVFCDRIQFLKENLGDQTFNVAVLGTPINLFPDPEDVLRDLLNALEPGGQLLFKLKNACDSGMFQSIFGNPVSAGTEKKLVLAVGDVKRMAGKYGAARMKVKKSVGPYTPEWIETVTNVMVNAKVTPNVQEAIENILTDEFLFHVTKAL